MALSRVSMTLRNSRVQLSFTRIPPRRTYLSSRITSEDNGVGQSLLDLRCCCWQKCDVNKSLVTGGRRLKSTLAPSQISSIDYEGGKGFDTEFLLEEDPELLQGLHPEDVGEQTFIRCSGAASALAPMPGEKDLIDTELDEFLAQDFPLEESSAPPIVDSLHLQPSESIVTPSKKKYEKKKRKESSSAPRPLKQEEREMAAKIKRAELEKSGREASLNKSLLAYLEMCVSSGQLNKALNSLNYYRTRSANKQFPRVSNISIFNLLLHGFAAKGNHAKVREVFQSILDDGLVPTAQSYAAILECLGRMTNNQHNLKKIQETMNSIAVNKFTLDDLFNYCVYEGDQREKVLEAIRRVEADFVPKIQPPFHGYVSPLLHHLNKTSPNQSIVSPAANLISSDRLLELGKQQLKIELHGTITVKSILKKSEDNSQNHFRAVLEETEKEWARSIEEAFRRNMNALMQQSARMKNQRAISLHPFLKVVCPADIVKIITQEIRKLAEGSETYSPSIIQLHRELGTRVLSRYEVIFKRENGILDKVDQHYQDYLQWYLHPEKKTDNNSRPILNAREKWQSLLYDPNTVGPTVDIAEKTWPNSVLCSIGRFLYGIIMRDIKINAQVMKLNSKVKSEQMVPAFYSIFRLQGVQLKEEIKPHPALVKLVLAAARDELTFDCNLVPMISPPMPWASIRTGGYLLSAAKIIRLPFQAHQQRLRLEQCPPQDLYPSLDSLNQLGSVPWRINKPVLDVIIKVFNDKGDDSTGVPPPVSECPVPTPVEATMTKEQKVKIYKSRLILKRKKAEMYSLWCDALYKLSLANHYRDEIFWFPHNMDFRGRVYPCPPHLNHLGSDLARSILVFGLGKPLGPEGLDWLKIHAVNLTGLKKKDSVADRLNYANKHLPDIMDSATKPLTGRRWWAKSDEPWQTLACCMEIANAIESGDPESYISHFPIHQDGSCNGLQHYAALGRDQIGAESVNLAPSELPQDVYTAVANLVEKLRKKDAENGIVVAQVLEGFIKRKVIKQTVMTTVYGVTRYGARLQIAKQLKDIPAFPKEHLWPASLYLVGKTFDSLNEMFTSTKEIQAWFTESARLVSNVCGQNMEWVTPLGLPIVQPYFRQLKKTFETRDSLKLREWGNYFDMFERPNVMKQKNAFPPNYIHSLDSTHMMLTSLHCEREKLTFVSVHDCFWTHPQTVEQMNRICREQFVALHSQPILEDLSTFLVQKYGYSKSDLARDGSVIDLTKNQLNRTLVAVPKKGTFDLQSVLKSIYFFS